MTASFDVALGDEICEACRRGLEQGERYATVPDGTCPGNGIPFTAICCEPCAFAALTGPVRRPWWRRFVAWLVDET